MAAYLVQSYILDLSDEPTKLLGEIDFGSFSCHLGLKSIFESADSLFEEAFLHRITEVNYKEITHDTKNKESFHKRVAKEEGSKKGLVQVEKETIQESYTNVKENKTIEKQQRESEEGDWTNIPENHPIIYKRELDPDLCTGFDTKAGKEIFKRAMLGNFMNIYFVLSQHFHTQCEPNYCAAGTLAMVLNSLKVDPRRMWKYPWRWYDEYMLNSCVSLETMKSSGCSFDDLACIARCNKLSVEAVRVSPKTSIIDFRNDVKRSCTSDDTVLIVNYARGVLNQTGTGHFTPIGGYDEKEDMVLILDTARFKHPPHWVSLEVCYRSIAEIETSLSGYTEDMSRGYYLMKKNELNPSVILKFSNNYTLTVCTTNQSKHEEIEIFRKIYKSWDVWLDTVAYEIKNIDLISHAIQQILQISRIVSNQTKIHGKNRKRENTPFNASITEEKLASTNVHNLVRAAMGTLSKTDIDNIRSTTTWIVNVFKPPSGILQTEEKNNWNIESFISSLILLWPYRTESDKSKQTFRSLLQSLISEDIGKFPSSLVLSIDQQIRWIWKALEHVGHEQQYCQQEYYFD
ncbi:uncharacterized protein LOC130662436 [Hydractinia symbiolongicarpus]|uniref:uncharacterized protein LOC130662436 n=1 Tax=Hydractinia symbiolongicarpus TaxID=13093 RepID=UPI002550A359|nr:uncharacterized protein LOC130662436 [Hydractinia symbiolongicarpus]